MTKEQLEKLLLLYKEAVKNILSSIDFAYEIREARIDLDRSFVHEGKENENLGQYLEELLTLENMKHEQS